MVRTSTSRLLVSWLLVGAVVGGCRTEAPRPVVESVFPTRLFTTPERDELKVYGRDFFPALSLGAGRRGEASVGGRFLVRLLPSLQEGEPIEFDRVIWEELTELTVSLSGVTLPEDVYDVEVVSPFGVSGLAPDLLEVTSELVSGLVLEISDISPEIESDTLVEITAVNPSALAVAQDVGVRLTFTSVEPGAEGPIGLDVDGDVDPDPDPGVVSGDDVSVTEGVLSGGSATMTLRGHEPGPVLVTVSTTGDYEGQVPTVSQVVQFENGRQRILRFDLSAMQLEEDGPQRLAVAGDAFDVTMQVVDEYGQGVDSANYDQVLIRSSCDATLLPTVSILGGRAARRMMHRTWNGNACRLGVVSGDGLAGQSEDYLLLPGPLDRFSLGLAVSSLEAGETIAVVVSPEDEWGNRIDWDGTIVSIVDDVGGLVDTQCSSAEITTCTGVVTRTAIDNRIHVVGNTGIEGSTAPFEVVPGPPVDLSVDSVESVWTAGSSTEVLISAYDAYGQQTDGSRVDVRALEFLADSDSPGCVYQGITPSGQLRFACTLFVVSEARALRVRNEVLGADAVSESFEVRSGPLARIEVTPGDTLVVAGSPLSVSVHGFDAWDNPFMATSDTQLSLDDTSGTLTPAIMLLGTDGTGIVEVTITRAGSTSVTVSHGLQVAGVSDPVVVMAGDDSEIGIRVVAPWVWAIESGQTPEPADLTEVVLEVLDGYGNRTDFVGLASLISESTDSIDESVPLSNGFGSVLVHWDEGAPQEWLLASTAGGLTGRSDTIVVVKNCAVLGPSPDVDFGGRTYGLVCLDEAGRGTLTGDLTPSAPAEDRTLFAFGLAIDGGADVTGLQPDLSLPIEEPGNYIVRVLAVQADGCGTSVEREVYAGPDNGSAVGPVLYQWDDPQLTVGDPFAVLAATVGPVSTCDGDPAAGQPLFLRSDRGVVLDAAPTGLGLELMLDAQGRGTFRLSGQNEDAGGTATVRGWSNDGAAVGSTQVDFVGDTRGPTVWVQSPKGEIFLPTDRVRLTFSEPIDPATMTTSSISLFGPSLPLVVREINQVSPSVFSIVLEDLVSVTPSSPYRLEVRPQVTDLAGNALRGPWAGASAFYRGLFGAPGLVEEISSCSVGTAVLRPDGDAGPGIEADEVQFDFASALAPVWWVVSVTDEQGDVVELEYLVPTGPADSWVWDARDVSTKVVESGEYTLEVEAEGNQGNRGGGCSRQVFVEQWGGM